MISNIIDLVIVLILAGVLGAVVKGLVSIIIMPIIGIFTGVSSFTNKVYELSPAVPEVLNGRLNY
ncbi:MAG: MscL family protein [Crocinitomicaceae bacterium]|nr:MscL family protein [Crocinitomicaceae bacterium]